MKKIIYESQKKASSVSYQVCSLSPQAGQTFSSLNALFYPLGRRDDSWLTGHPHSHSLNHSLSQFLIKQRHGNKCFTHERSWCWTIMPPIVLIVCLPQWLIRSWWNSHIRSWMSSGQGHSWQSSRKLNIMFIWTKKNTTVLFRDVVFHKCCILALFGSIFNFRNQLLTEQFYKFNITFVLVLTGWYSEKKCLGDYIISYKYKKNKNTYRVIFDFQNL